MTCFSKRGAGPWTRFPITLKHRAGRRRRLVLRASARSKLVSGRTLILSDRPPRKSLMDWEVDVFRIGEFAQIAQVSGRQLRFYDQLGLLQPAHTDGQTGYRYYSIRQLPR